MRSVPWVREPSGVTRTSRSGSRSNGCGAPSCEHTCVVRIARRVGTCASAVGALLASGCDSATIHKAESGRGNETADAAQANPADSTSGPGSWDDPGLIPSDAAAQLDATFAGEGG